MGKLIYLKKSISSAFLVRTVKKAVRTRSWCIANQNRCWGALSLHYHRYHQRGLWWYPLFSMTPFDWRDRRRLHRSIKGTYTQGWSRIRTSQQMLSRRVWHAYGWWQCRSATLESWVTIIATTRVRKVDKYIGRQKQLVGSEINEMIMSDHRLKEDLINTHIPKNHLWWVDGKRT